MKNFFCFPVCMFYAGSFCPYCLYCRFWERLSHQPVLHIFPHWNLQGHEGEEVTIFAYSNCDEVELLVNGKK